MVDIWPELPICICDYGSRLEATDNDVAVLKLKDRVSQIRLLKISTMAWERYTPLMEGLFPTLTHSCVQPFSSSRTLPGSRSISRIIETTFVCYQSCLPYAFEHSTFGVYFSRIIGQLYFRAEPARITFPYNRTTSVSQSYPNSTSARTHSPPYSYQSLPRRFS